MGTNSELCRYVFRYLSRFFELTWISAVFGKSCNSSPDELGSGFLVGGGHLLANGDQAHVVLFGAFLIYGLISIFSGYLKRQKPALDKRPPIGLELVFLAIVALVYIGLIWGHRYFTGMPLV